MSFDIKTNSRYDELEKKFKRKIKIVIPNYKHNKNKTLSNFIEEFINGDFYTIYKKNGRQQCHKGAYRSLGDLYNLAREYFPDVKLVELMNILVELYNSGNIRPDYCYTIRKRVFRPGIGYKSGTFLLRNKDENGLIGADYLEISKK